MRVSVPSQPQTAVKAAMGSSQSTAPAASTRAKRTLVNRAWAGAGVLSPIQKLVESSACVDSAVPCAPPRLNWPGQKRWATTPVSAAANTTAGNGICSSATAIKLSSASTHNSGARKVRLPMRTTACKTSAATAGLTPHKTAASQGVVPNTIYAQLKPMSSNKDGNTNSRPAATPPQVRCISQPR